MPTAEGTLDRTLVALADPTRRAVVALLSRTPSCSSDMADELGASRPAMSKHLRVLREAQLVEDRPRYDDARVRVYQLRRERISELRTWVEEVEAFWGEQLAAFKAHAERTRPGGSSKSTGGRRR